MMKYELENFWKPFHGEIDFIIELDLDKDETPTDVADIRYYMDAHGTGHIKLIPTSVLTRKNSIEIRNPTETQQVLKKLVTFIEENNIEDESASDGDGHYDTWRSGEFEQLIEEAKEVI